MKKDVHTLHTATKRKVTREFSMVFLAFGKLSLSNKLLPSLTNRNAVLNKANIYKCSYLMSQRVWKGCVYPLLRHSGRERAGKHTHTHTHTHTHLTLPNPF